MAHLLVATAKATNANSFCDVLRADAILRTRLYTDAWFVDAGTTPDAEDYQTDTTAAIGASSVTVDLGTGTLTKGADFQFAGHATIYTAKMELKAAGTLSFTPVLTATLADNEKVSRLTANDKERSLVWASRLFDMMMVWKGTKREETGSMRWPRSGVIGPDGFFYDFDIIPVILEEGTAELALYLLSTDAFTVPSILGQGLLEARIDVINVKVDSSAVNEVIPANILSLIDPLGHLESAAQRGSSIVTLRRT